MKDAAFVIPVHSPRFRDFGVPVVQSYNDYFEDNDLFVVFSDSEEATEFASMAGDLRYTPVVCDEQYTCTKPITQKKFFGVNYVYNNTDKEYVAAIDADCLFIAHKDYSAMFADWFNKKTLFGTTSNNHSIIHNVGRATAKLFFSREDVTRLEELTENFTCYHWFNEIPVYNRETFMAFMEYIDYHNNKHKLEYITFDYMMYSFFMLANGHFRLEKVNTKPHDGGSLLEAQKLFEPAFFEDVFKHYSPMWIKNPIGHEHMKNVFIRFHTDRG